MTTTPISKSKLSCRDVKGKTVIRNDSPTLQLVTKTPNRNSQEDGDGDYSPIYFPLTQDTNEEIDVMWDWNSPQSSQRKRRKQKRLIPIQSPKVPLQRHPSNQNDNFERLRNELKLLQEELALPDDDASVLCVSPQQEVEAKKGESNINLGSQWEFDDPFNDSMDEQLVQFSQKIENELLTEKKSDFSTICDNTQINNLINKYNDKKIMTNSLTDIFEESMTNNKVETKPVVNTSKHSKFTFQRTFSDVPKSENIIQTTSGKLEFHRTKSFELSNIDGKNNAPKVNFEEIERKRLEAKAKLEAKMKKNGVMNKSPVKCSVEEIEKKRLQALAKLEAKKLQDIVEKKRQEALKKLQSRKQNASQVKSTLTKRF